MAMNSPAAAAAAPFNFVSSGPSMTYPNGDVWYGQLEQFKPRGFGTMKYAGGSTFKGSFVRGCREGFGELTFPPGQFGKRLRSEEDENYKGMWKNDKRHGKGVASHPLTGSYDGEWKDDMHDGVGIRQFKDGRSYNGQWKSGMRNGNGAAVLLDGVYTGQWRDDNREGKGKMNWKDGSSYDGEWKKNKPEGRGKHVSRDSAIYEGEWCNGYRDGLRVYIPGRSKTSSPFDVNSTFYDGSWSVGQYEGQGRAVYANGDEYVGMWSYGQYSGKGVQKKVDGTTYLGEWYHGYKHGRGKLVTAAGETVEGIWKYGQFVEPIVIASEVPVEKVGDEAVDSSVITCVVCIENRKSTLLMPCKHLCVCSECAKQVDNCPMCRKKVTDRIGIYL